MAAASSSELVANTFAPGALFLETLISLSLGFRAWRDVIGLQAILASCEKLDKLAEAWERVTLFFHFNDLPIPS